MKGLGHGQVWWADLDEVRPVVVLTRARIAPRLRRVLIAPVTTIVRGMPPEVSLGKDEGVKPGSVANLDNVHLLPVEQLVALAGVIDPDRWPEFCAAMRKVMDC